LTLLALTWSRLGGWLLIAIGDSFYGLQLWRAAGVYDLTLAMIVSW